MKNFPKEWNDDDIRKLFESHGELLSVKIERDNKGESKGFGFVCFADSDKARDSISDLNGKVVDGLELFVGRFEKKSERTRKLKMEMSKNTSTDSNSKKNLYVKFINESVDENMLRKEFEVYGKVSSVKIQVENVTKGDKEYEVHRG